MSAKRDRIICSLNDQRLDVRLGIISQEEWDRRAEGGHAQICEADPPHSFKDCPDGLGDYR